MNNKNLENAILNPNDIKNSAYFSKNPGQSLNNLVNSISKVKDGSDIFLSRYPIKTSINSPNSIFLNDPIQLSNIIKNKQELIGNPNIKNYKELSKNPYYNDNIVDKIKDNALSIIRNNINKIIKNEIPNYKKTTSNIESNQMDEPKAEIKEDDFLENKSAIKEQLRSNEDITIKDNLIKINLKEKKNQLRKT